MVHKQLSDPDRGRLPRRRAHPHLEQRRAQAQCAVQSNAMPPFDYPVRSRAVDNCTECTNVAHTMTHCDSAAVAVVGADDGSGFSAGWIRTGTAAADDAGWAASKCGADCAGEMAAAGSPPFADAAPAR